MQAQSIFADPIPPNPATSTPRDRRQFIVENTRFYARELALEDLLAPQPSIEPLPELPDPGEPMPDDLCTFWDRLSPAEQRCINGSKLWTGPGANHPVRIARCIVIFRQSGLSLRQAISLCRFPDGLGSDMPRHAELLRALWRAREIDYPPAPRLEHLEAVAGFGARCGGPRDEVLIVAANAWDGAQQYANNFLEALRRRLWPMCRAQLPEETILSATDDLQCEWNVFVPDELLLPLLNKIDKAAAPRRGRRRRA